MLISQLPHLFIIWNSSLINLYFSVLLMLSCQLVPQQSFYQSEGMMTAAQKNSREISLTWGHQDPQELQPT